MAMVFPTLANLSSFTQNLSNKKIQTQINFLDIIQKKCQELWLNIDDCLCQTKQKTPKNEHFYSDIKRFIEYLFPT